MEASLSKRFRLDLFDGVQRRATKLISGLMGLYKDRLNILKLTTLETRRLRCDLMEAVFKMFRGFDNLDPLMFFVMKRCT